MTFDLKYGLPFALPFFFLALIRVLFWAASSEWSEPGAAAVASFVIGQVVGWIVVGIMADRGTTWAVRFPAAREGGAERPRPNKHTSPP